MTVKENMLTDRERDAQAAIARQVKSLRQARRWSLDELSSRSGVSKGMLVQIEGARTNPSIGTLCRLAEAFGVSIGRLLEAEPEPVVKIVFKVRLP